MSSSIPILYYHSVGNHHSQHIKSFLTLPQALFEKQMCWLKDQGYKTIFLQDVYDYVSGKRQVVAPEVALTFDDGFLDNWVHVFPLAQKLGFKFTIYVNPEFVDPRDIVRPTLQNVWRGEVQETDLQWWGYLSWAEMREMEASGLVDIQSHALTHTWYPTGPEIIDFHHPGAPYPWLIWNSNPKTKPFWLTEYDEMLVPYGTPIYKFGKSIPTRRFLPDPQLDRRLVELVSEQETTHFFSRADWREVLQGEADSYRQKEGENGRYETTEERQQRLFDEVVTSKKIIEEALSKEVRFICWPGGGEDPIAREIALNNGYLATTKGKELNRPGADPTHMFRISSWFGSGLPNNVKWFLYKGQLDRARGRMTAPGMLTHLLSLANRSLSLFNK